MPINGISVGKDITVVLANVNGQIEINRVKHFTSTQKISAKETMALDGINRHLNIPMGWSGSFEMERISPVMDAFFYQLEQAYLNGQVIPPTTITENITEVDGTITTFQYIGAYLDFNNTGEWKGDELITQKMNFVAQQRNQLA